MKYTVLTYYSYRMPLMICRIQLYTTVVTPFVCEALRCTLISDGYIVEHPIPVNCFVFKIDNNLNWNCIWYSKL